MADRSSVRPHVTNETLDHQPIVDVEVPSESHYDQYHNSTNNNNNYDDDDC
jgi:hypothetical protein